MPNERILADAGPIIAIFDGDESHHAACVRAAKAIRGPLYTAWPAVAEAAHLLAFSRQAQDAVFEWIESGGLVPLPLDSHDMPRIRELMNKYADLPADFADAALVRLAEREGVRTIFTLDRDFRVLKPSHTRAFRLIP